MMNLLRLIALLVALVDTVAGVLTLAGEAAATNHVGI